MIFFAITPDSYSSIDVLSQSAKLKAGGARFLYLRSPLLQDDLQPLTAEVSALGILPLVPFRLCSRMKGTHFGIHVQGRDLEAAAAQERRPAAVYTAACHNPAEAEQMLQSFADYVFVSPVFRPLSKNFNGRLFPRESLHALTAKYGERIVLLGGMTEERIAALKQELKHDFSVAGISMFFMDKRIQQ